MAVNLQSIRAFAANASGNVAMIFALGAAPLLAASGVAIDYSRASNARSAISTAADAAALAGASARGDATLRERMARQVFEANLAKSGYSGPVSVSYLNLTNGSQNSGYRVEATSNVRSLMGSFTGASETAVKFVSQAQTPILENTEIVFVLDTTDSMEGSRIDALKSAANGVLDEISSRAAASGTVKVGVVPFSQYVNVGLQRRNASWLDVRADYQNPVVETCNMQRVQVGETNCRNVNFPAEPSIPASTCMRDGRPRPCGGSNGRAARSERVCDPVMSSDLRRVCSTSGGDWVRWNGCVGSRAYPLETQDARYDVRIPGMMGISCGSPILDPTTDITRVRSTINGLTTQGETYLPAGLIWGWRMLSPQEPLAGTTPRPGDGSRKVMILVTDGRNTKSPNYPDHEGNDGAMADRLTNETCSNIAADRANAIRVYTIAFEMDGLDAKRILQNCSSRTGGQFYDATDADKLRQSFRQALDAIMSVRLTQ